ncbi:MAG: beta-ketoacyl synthase N-terminal-like domain-containing protein, partial [Bacteroidota bacterium]
MKKVYAGAENIISSLGFNVEENISNIIDGRSGIKIDRSGIFSPVPLPLSMIDHGRLNNSFEDKHIKQYTLLEKMFIYSINDSIKRSGIDISADDTLIIFTTTKGNIDLLSPKAQHEKPVNRVSLPELARIVAAHFKNPNTPMIISNACISGVVGLIYGERMLRSGKYKHIVVSGGDLMSEFVVSGFQSFQSLSMAPCRPFDKDRDGLNLGEGCGTIILSSDPAVFLDGNPIRVLGGAGSNDANHISGPSRTGEGLQIAIRHSLEFSGVSTDVIDSISAHG